MKCVSLLLLVVAVVVVSASKDNWIVGFSAQNISPSEGESCCLGGYGECLCSRQQTGVHDPIFARAFYLKVGTEEMVFVSIDTVGMSNRFIDDCISNSSAYISDPNRIIMSSTHSHSSPDFAGIWGGVGAEYRKFAISQVVQAIAVAKTSAVEAQLYIAKGEHDQTSNRRGWDSTDYTVLTLWATDINTGDLIGMLVNFGAHPTILGSDNTMVSRDWVNGLIVTLEEKLGADTVMYVNAAQGDVSASRSGLTGDGFDKCFEYGENLAQTVLKSLDNSTSGAVSIVYPEVYLVFSFWTQCVTNNLFIAAANSLGLCSNYIFRDAKDGECPHGKLELPPKLVDTQLAYIRLGQQVQLAVLPGEATTRMAIDGVGATGFNSSTDAIKESMTAPYQGVFGLSTDFLGYFVPEDEWNKPKHDANPDNSDYEESVSLGGDQANVWIRDRVKSLIASDSFTPEP
mmetsp:Transcript_12995/g.20002  ORF Transcript_12995/g.20002 Transcript_12995/m.20002 type:complete len:457 (-) Transcript_12995:86-1456(-)